MDTLLLILIAFVLLIIIYLIYAINKFVYLKKRIERSKATIDVFLKERFDLIPNLVECVKGYMNYESNTLEHITNLRNSFREQVSEDAGNQLNQYYKGLLATVEKYPELKASESFMNLQKNLEKIESEIAAARRIYINDITNFNTKVASFPTNLIAKIFHYKEFSYPLFETEEIKIQF